MGTTHNEVSGGNPNAIVQVGIINGPVTVGAPSPPAPTYLMEPERWPLAASWDPLAAGTHRARPGPDDAGVPPYIERDIDAELRSRLAEADQRGGLVLVRGHSTSGKTRAAFEALRAALPRHRVIAPTPGAGLSVILETIARTRVPCVIWLDELEAYLGPGDLDSNTLSECERLHIPVLATIRVRMFEIFNPARYAHTLGTDADRYQTMRIGARVLARTDPIDLPRIWSDRELHRARSSDDERLVDAIEHHGLHGVAEYLAAGPRIWSEWRRAADIDGSPRGAALVAAAVDLARTGLVGPYSQDLLIDLHEHYLAERGGALLRPEPLQDALAWASAVRLGVTSPLLPAGEDRWGVFDYLVDSVERLSPPQPVPDIVWPLAAENAADVADSLDIAVHAAEAKTSSSIEVAERIWRSLADEGMRLAAYNLGVLRLETGREEEAKELFEKVAEDGEPRAAYNLGIILFQEGKISEAKRWNKRAADAGHPAAMFNFALDLAEQGRIDEARDWYQRSAELGDHHAATNLGNVLHEAGRSEEAQQWYHQAAEAEDHYATNNIAVYHHQRGEIDQAEHWYRLAFERGCAWAAVSLAVLFKDSGRVEEAEQWSRRAADGGFPEGGHLLGKILEESRRQTEAEEWYRFAADAGHDPSVYALVRILYDTNRLEEAAPWIARAAAKGDRVASRVLGEILHELGRTEEAITHLTAAADAGELDAAFNLGAIFTQTDRLDEARHWYRMAAESGDAEAATNLADVLLRKDLVASAIWWTRRARSLRSGTGRDQSLSSQPSARATPTGHATPVPSTPQ